MIDLVVHKKRNSLIELYRFFFAMNVVIGHGLFPINIPYFGPDRISVEFFFILSGFLFVSSMEKFRDKPIVIAIWKMTVSKIKPLFIPMVIGLISNAILNYITGYTPIKIFRYLWYIPAMMAIFLLYTALRIVIKNDKCFWCTVGLIFISSAIMRFSGSDALFLFDYVRSALAVSLGMLIAKIPAMKIKRKWILWIMITLIAATTFIIIFFRMAQDERIYEALLNLILYPILIYLTFNIDFHFPIFNYLGGLSFGIYAFQCPARLAAAFGASNKWIPFAIIIGLTLIYDLVKRIYKKVKGGS